MGDYGAMCPVFRPTREEFEQPFCDYVKKVFRKFPDLPMFKVVPPRGWKPRRTPFPDLRKVQINVPIRQHVFGTKGAYRCLFMEQKPMSVAEYKLAAEEETQRLRGGHGREGDVQAAVGVRASTRATSARLNRPPPNPESSPAQRAATAEGDAADGAQQQQQQAAQQQHQQQQAVELDAVDADMERSFWANVTLNPPMYGADTPTSFFDEKLPYGWNLRHLGDLLQNHPKVDSVPGVTTPMTYFGMWRSFFGWHKEDADLYSVNFLHWGAPKIWYGVAPGAKQKFDRMAQSLFPDLHRVCPAFVRHKDIMLSPSSLKTYGVPYMRACQRPNEFVVLNAAAYHAGFNSGFNCAEAVNFGMKEWIPVGKAAVPCRCTALKDGVRISMKLFDPKWVDPYETPSESEGEDSEEAPSSSEEEEAPAKRRRGRGGKAAAAPAKRGRPRKKVQVAAADSSEEEEQEEEEEVAEEPEEEKPDEVAKPRRKRTITKKAAAAAAAAAEAASARKRSRSKTLTPAATKGTDARKKVAAAAAVKKAASRSRAGAATPSTKATTATATSPPAKRGAAAAAAGATKAPAASSKGRKPGAASEPAGEAGRKRKVAAAAAAEDPDDDVVIVELPARLGCGAQEGGEQPWQQEDRAGRSQRRAGAAETAQSAPASKRARGSAGTEGPAPAEAVAKAGSEGDAGAAAGRPVRASGRRAALTRATSKTETAVVGAGKDATAADAGQAVPPAGARGRGARAAARAANAAAVAAVAEATVDPTGPPAPEVPAGSGMSPDGRPVVTAVKPRSTVEASAMALKARARACSQEVVVGPPMAIVGDDATAAGRRAAAAAAAAAAGAASNAKRFFFLVQRLARPASTPGNVLLRWLKEGRDGLFRPVTGSVWEEPAGALLPVHVLAVCSGHDYAATPAGVFSGGATSDGEHGGDSGVSSSTSAAGAGAASVGGATGASGGCGVPAAVAEPEAWRLMTPREQIVDVVLRRE